tara:strand:+ start:2898 stop:3542 length:645 start_codon:yes stop_codon:yes gene_type:complete
MKSQFRDNGTVGTIYQEAQKNNTSGLVVQDIGTELANSLVTDLNKTIESNPFSGKPFYINIVEERDLQMKNAIKRRLFVSQYRPYPEDNTLVFHVEPSSCKVSYCWDIPHHSEFYNIISNFLSYDNEYISMLRQWMDNDLSNFGFIKVSMDSSQVEGYDIKTVNAYRDSYLNFLRTKEVDEKTIEAEIKLGFFWIPNKFHTDKTCEEKTGKIIL